MGIPINRLEEKIKSFLRSTDSEKKRKIKDEIYTIIFREDLCNFWDERLLLGISKILSEFPPNEEVYGSKKALILERTERVKKINDFFYAVIK